MNRFEQYNILSSVENILSFVMLFFFFSSRRRHTRLQGDWSSDVCSSDLAAQRWHAADGGRRSQGARGLPAIEADAAKLRAVIASIEQVLGPSLGTLDRNSP